MPELSLLSDPPESGLQLDEREIKIKSNLLVEKLSQFSVRGEVVGIKPGPAVTMFEFKPAADVKISKIVELADDLSLALSSESVRIIAPIPGRNVVGIETSNSSRETVYLKDVLEHDPFWSEEIKLPVALGRQADGEPKIVDLRKMPHLLVAGTTGSGKSVFVVSVLTALLFRHSPETLKLILVDPKQVDLAAFNDLPHLIMPPIRDPKKAVGALRWAIKEMDKRYRSMSKFGARGIEEFNKKVKALSKEKIEQHETFNDELEGVGVLDSYYYTPQPYICIVVEEFGDLMAVDKANVEQAVVRLAQMARACGIHLLLAMQSPRKDVVTGLIKTNIPGRISFKVSSKMDSRIILDEAGGERLLARGDMLFLAPGVSKPMRHHGAYLSEDEIGGVVDYWKDQGEADYDPLAMRAIQGSGGGYDFEGGVDEDLEEEKDERYDEILAYVASMKEVSASLLQRKFRLGYPRAARMIEIFENEGVVGPANGSKPRQVLVRDLSDL
jgi:S-DNA-T family DNA segregation ATPase FtsK/SpoIIIE